jgi:hypothetical protein
MEQSVLEGRKKISRSSSLAVELVKWNDEYVCVRPCCHPFDAAHSFERKSILHFFLFFPLYRLNIVQLVWESKEIDGKWTGKDM